MIKAYQIVDLNNPISVQYMERSLKSFRNLEGIMEIIPFQCFTPDTMPSDIFKTRNKNTPVEKAILYSHYSLVKRIAEGEQLFIMEHDAHLWAGQEEQFLALLPKAYTHKTWLCGIAMEFYTVSERVAKTYCRFVEREGQEKIGPMRTLFDASNCHKSGQILWPQAGQQNFVCESYSAFDSAKGKGKQYKAPVTQHVDMSIGITNNDRANKHIVTPKGNPDVFFG